MLKLALIGKDISHSCSEQIYSSLLQKKFSYTLLDFQKQAEIPSLENLKNNFDGISITAPYKKFFIKDVTNLSSLDIINTIRFKNSLIEATNTDYMAIQKILTNHLQNGIKTIHLLGDGSMSEIVVDLLKDSPIKLLQYSRKKSTLQIFENSSEKKDLSHLVINTCSRDYLYSGDLSSAYHFWDMNYNMNTHKDYFKSSGVNYSDGLEQLRLQASFAIDFWGF